LGQPSPNAFTRESQTVERVLLSDCQVCAGFDAATVPPAQHFPMQQFRAIWDTGATNCVITQYVVDQCGLKATGVAQTYGVHGVGLAETFLVNIALPNRVRFSNVEVTLGDLPAGSHALIGMDIIAAGDFAITNHQGKTVFSFRLPSCGRIDFTKDLHGPEPPRLLKHGMQHGGGNRRRR
jgi:hypothetical protein